MTTFLCAYRVTANARRIEQIIEGCLRCCYSLLLKVKSGDPKTWSPYFYDVAVAELSRERFGLEA